MKNFKINFCKVILITLVFSLNSFNGKAQAWFQHIDSLKIIPSNPTTEDTIKLISYCMLGYFVQYDTSFISSNDSLVYVYTYYFDPDPLAETYDPLIDTISIGQLNAEVYKIKQLLFVRYLYPNNPDTSQYYYIDSDSIEFIITSVESMSCQDNINIFPNPVSNFVNIEINNKSTQKNYKIEITDIKGQTIFSKSNVRNSIQIDLSDYMAGIYFISVKHQDKIIQSRKIIVK